jgi:putative NADH-flavin reductase
MQLTIFGAAGRTGRHLVGQALEAGHSVTAFARNPGQIGADHPNLRIVAGDVRDATKVAEAIAGVDAVLSALGPAKDSGTDLLQTAARNIVGAMQQHGVRRLVYLTGAGVKQPQDPPSLGASVMVPLLKLISPQVLADSEAAVTIVQESGLDWIVVRAPRLGDGPATEAYRTGYLRGNFKQIPRADVAHFMLQQAADTKYVREAPMVLV